MLDFGQLTFPDLDLAWILSAVLFVPYLGWGVYLLHKQLDENIEVSPAVEAVTLAAVGVFLLFQYHLMWVWLDASAWKFIPAVLGLIASAVVLYGHTAVRLGSALLVNAFMPSAERRTHEPEYASAEAQESHGDFDAAAETYQTVAALHPKDPTAAIRAGDTLMKAGRVEEAAGAFAHSLTLIDSPERSLPVTFRLADIYYRSLQEPEKARAVLESYLRRFPDAERAEAVRCRLDRMNGQSPSVR
jgi:tetratricopeptide (TPR) repeat protein